MKLYQHPASTTCRPIILFAAEEGLQFDMQTVDILSGEQYGEAFTKINPSNFVPVLEDGDFRLIESSAILKYLADKTDSKAYPTELKARARVNERMDWINTNFYRSFGYGVVYPQVLDSYKLPDAGAQKLLIAAGLAQACRFLKVMNDHLLGGGAKWLAGERITIADYFASGIISVGEVIGCTFKDYPNIAAWYRRMKTLPNWQSSNGGLYYWAKAAAGPDYVRV